MSFRLKQGRPIGHELRRVIDRQLEGVIESIQQAQRSTEGAAAVHAARRHVKKAHAVLRLTRSSLGQDVDAIDRRLRRANRMLGPIADAHAIGETLDRLEAFSGWRLSPTIVKTLRASLRERAERIERQVEFVRVRERIVRLLSAERERVQRWTTKGIGRSVVIAGITKVHREARQAMRAALARPTVEAFHTWRQLAKEEWYLVRLIAERCEGGLADEARRLEALDGCLGDLHNVGILHDLIASDSPLSRSEAATCLLALRAYRRELRYQAHEMGRIYAEHPRRFAQRLRAAWSTTSLDVNPVARPRSWARVA